MAVATNPQVQRISAPISALSWPDLAAVLISGLMFVAFTALPWFNLASEEGLQTFTGLQLLTTMPRGVPRYEVISLFFVLLGTLLAFGASLVGFLRMNARWITPILAGVGGLLAVFHFITFFNQNALADNARIGAGIWLAAAASVVLVLLTFVRRNSGSILRDALSTSIGARYSYLFVAPAIVVLAMLVFFPLVNGILLSFTNANQFNSLRVVGSRVTPAAYTFFIGVFDNYRAVFETDTYNFWNTFRQTLTWTAFNVPVHILIGLGLAMLLNRPIAGRTIYRIILILPWAVPSYISAFAWRFLYNGDFGFFNNLATSLGLAPAPWLSDPGLAMFSVIVANTWLAIPFNMVTMLGGLQSIPGDLYEAADVDGANAWAKFRFITLPMLRPVMMTATLLGVIWTFNAFNVIFLVSEGGPFRSTELLSTWAWRLGIEQSQYGVAAAFSVIILVILIIFSITYISVLSRSGQQQVL